MLKSFISRQSKSCALGEPSTCLDPHSQPSLTYLNDRNQDSKRLAACQLESLLEDSAMEICPCSLSSAARDVAHDRSSSGVF
jgi:hypothetical protein